MLPCQVDKGDGVNKKRGVEARHHTQIWGLKCRNWSSQHKKYKLFLNRNKLWSVNVMVLGP